MVITPLVASVAIDALLSAGALDAWYVPIVMKHGRVHDIMTVPLKRPRPDLGIVRGTPEFAETRYKVWRALHDEPTVH